MKKELSAKAYDVVTTACVFVAIASALSFEKLPQLQWLFGAIGALAGVTAIAAYFLHQEISQKSDTEAREESSPRNVGEEVVSGRQKNMFVTFHSKPLVTWDELATTRFERVMGVWDPSSAERMMVFTRNLRTHVERTNPFRDLMVSAYATREDYTGREEPAQGLENWTIDLMKFRQDLSPEGRRVSKVPRSAGRKSAPALIVEDWSVAGDTVH